MSRNIDIVAVAFIVVVTCVGSAFSSFVQRPWMQRYSGVQIEQQLFDRIQPEIQEIHQRIYESIQRNMDCRTRKLTY